MFQGHEDTGYDGIADIAFIAIVSRNGKFGGLRAANAHFFASQGYTGVYAPGAAFQGPVFIGNIGAFGDATPVIIVGSTGYARITGGNLAEENGRAVQVSAGLTQLKVTGGSTSGGGPVASGKQSSHPRESRDRRGCDGAGRPEPHAIARQSGTRSLEGDACEWDSTRSFGWAPIAPTAG